MKSVPFLTFVCACIMCLSSCRPGFDLAHLQAPPQQAELLPRLELVLDPVSFGNLYPASFMEGERTDESGNIIYISKPVAQTSYQDVHTLASRTLNQSMCFPGGEYFGIAQLRVTSQTVMPRAQGLIFLSTISAFLLNVVGMPFGKTEGIIEFELDLIDSRNRVLKTYRGQGYANQWQGLYYGGGDARRTVHAKAIKSALEDIQTQITAEVSTLRKVLIEIGPLGEEKLKP